MDNPDATLNSTLNSTPNSTLDTMFARRSISRLTDPGPTDDELATMLSAAVAAPDHGEARPWRFVVFSGDDRAAFGEVLARSYSAACESSDSAVDPDRLDKERRRFLRAPVVVAVLCRMQARRVVPAEQRDAVAAATQNLLLAATALGYGSIWRTGDAAVSPVVHTALGLEPADAIVGFVYLGTVPAGCELPPRRIDPAVFIERPEIPSTS
jgi:nitroreductase